MTSGRIETVSPGTPEELAGPPEAPTRRGDRFATLDTLRGFALLGILILNIEDFSGPEALWDIPIGLAKPAFIGWHTHLDQAIVALKWLFAEGKMRGLFAMLFGAGVVLLTERLDRHGRSSRSAVIFYRRNLWLGLFGLIHGFVLWLGDILFDYAILGLVFLYPLRHMNVRRLIVIGLSVWIIGGTFGSVRALHAVDTLRSEAQLEAAKAAGSAATPAQRGLIAASAAKQRDAVSEVANEVNTGRLGFIAGWPHRITEERDWLALKFRSGWVLEWLGAMIMGMGLYKSGFLTNQRPVRDYVLFVIGGYMISSPIVLIGLWHTWQAGISEAADARWMLLPYSLEAVTGTLANTALLLLMLRSSGVRRFLFPLSAVGRTAFSNYILTTVICQFIFAWGPWKLFGKLEYYQCLYVVAAIWATNLLLSSLWLRVFAFGPLEWAWRSLTYWKRQPLLVSSLA